MKRKGKRLLCGLGFDHKDEHLRATKGPNFILLGGSEPTHQMMQEKAIKFNEKMKRRGKTLETLHSEEFYEIGQELGLKPLNKDEKEE